jgi:hypothetical protein
MEEESGNSLPYMEWILFPNNSINLENQIPAGFGDLLWATDREFCSPSNGWIDAITKQGGTKPS